MSPLDILRSLGACGPELTWVASQRDQTPQALWLACRRGDRLDWYLGRLGARDGRGSPAHRRAVLVACLCARTAARWWPVPECERAVSLAELWALGDDHVSVADLLDAARAARAAYDYCYRAEFYIGPARDTAYTDAVRAAYDAASIGANARYFPSAARNAADAVAVIETTTGLACYDDNVRERRLRDIADLIRAAVPEVPL